TGRELRRQLSLWSQNDPAFASLAQKSFLAQQAAATPSDLSAIGAAGLRTLDAIAAGTQFATDQQTQLNSVLTEAAKPKGQLVLIPVSSIRKLVDAASQPGTCTNQKP